MALAAIVMAGGRGRRLHLRGVEKPLLKLRGKPLIGHVVSALRAAAEVNGIIVAVTRHNPATKAWAEKNQLDIVETPGRGIIHDAQYVLRKKGLRAALVVAADLPLMSSRSLDAIVRFSEHATEKCVVTCIRTRSSIRRGPPLASTYAMRRRGMRLLPVGVNVILKARTPREKLDEAMFVLPDPYEAVNVNSLHDLRWVEEYLKEENS